MQSDFHLRRRNGIKQDLRQLFHHLLGADGDAQMLFVVAVENTDHVAVLVCDAVDLLDIIADDADVEEVGLGSKDRDTVDAVQRVAQRIAAADDLCADVIVICFILQRGDRHTLDNVRQAVQRQVKEQHLLQRFRAGAVADAIAPKIIAAGRESLSGKMKCKAMRAISTSKVVNTA